MKGSAPERMGYASHTGVSRWLNLWGRAIVRRGSAEGEAGGWTLSRGQRDQVYFHSHSFEVVAPFASTSYSKAAHALLRRASFLEAV